MFSNTKSTCFITHLRHYTCVTCPVDYLFYVQYFPYVDKCCVLVSSPTYISCYISLVLLMIVFYLEVNYLLCTLLVLCSVCHLRCNILVYKYTHDLRKSVSYTCFVDHLSFSLNTTCINFDCFLLTLNILVMHPTCVQTSTYRSVDSTCEIHVSTPGK